MDILEVAKTTEAIVGLILALFGLGGGALLWLRRQIKMATKDTEHVLDQTQKDNGRRIGDLESRVVKLTGTVDGVSSRVNDIEKSMEGVARQRDLHKVELELAAMNGSLGAKVDTMSGIIHSLRATLIRVSEKEDGR